MWKSRTIFALCAAAAAVVLNSRPAAQAPDPRTLPKLSQSNLEYRGRFRLPLESINGQSFYFAQGQLAYNPGGNGGNGSFFMAWGSADYAGWNAARMVEVTIPEPSLAADIGALPIATYIQGFVDPTEGHLIEHNDPNGIDLKGHLVVGDRIIGGIREFYDGNYGQTATHYSRSINLTQPSFSGWSKLTNVKGKPGYVAGWLASIPAEWQSVFGEGMAIAGGCCGNIIDWASWGPSMFLFNPSLIGTPEVATQPLLYYDGAHPTLGSFNSNSANDKYNQTARIAGVALINGTRTALFFGSIGTGAQCYGGTPPCTDPTSNDSGGHAYPYRHQWWAYDLAAIADADNPWEPVPEIWPITDLPSNADEDYINFAFRPGGIAYVPQTQMLYVTTDKIDINGCCDARPLVYVFKVNIPNGNAVSSVDLSADRPSPQPANTTINWTATATGGVTPLQYKWSVYDGTSWNDATTWTTSNQFAWTPTSASSSYQVRVSARSAGNSSNTPEAFNDSPPYTISGGSGTASSITITPDHASPQPAGTPIVWTAAVTGGTGPLQYRWWFWDGGSSHDQTGWTTSSTFTWTPIYGNPNYAIKAFVRSAGNTSDTPEAETYVAFPTSGPGPATDVTLASSHSSPQPPGTAITWTATPIGGVPQQEYKFRTLEPSGWVTQQEWSTNNTFVWTFTQTGNVNRVAVWVRSHGNTQDAPEAEKGSDWFTIQ